jgi:biopolymer transport protein ExbD
MSIRLFINLLIVSIMLTAGGCASAQVLKPAGAHVRVTSTGGIYVGKDATSLKKLAKQLKKNGIKPGTQIIIEIPTKTPPRALTAITQELANNGYRRILFSKPRKATAEKGEDPLLKDLRK